MSQSQKHLPIATGVLAVTLLIGGLTLWTSAQPMIPERVELPASPQVSSTPTAPPSTEPYLVPDTNSPGPAQETVTVIVSSEILSLKIPAVKINVKSSGETWPRKSERCHGGSTCIDPPVFKEIAWYGAYALPSIPSEDSVLLFGHSNWINRKNQAFNNLPAVKAGDEVVVTTETGVFTYEAREPVLVDYDKIPYSELVFGHVPNRVVLVTCNSAEDAATVVVADLTSAEHR